MSYEDLIESSAGRIRETTLGAGSSSVTVGGAAALPFHPFDGDFPHRPRVAMEVFDVAPESWPAALFEAIEGLTGDPAAWARANVERFGADMVCVQLAGTDPNGADRSPEEGAKTVAAVAAAVEVPIIVYGSGNPSKDAEVLKKVAETVTGTVLALGPATEDNYRPITAAALAYGHTVIAETPIDVNMAKQLNILITQIGLPADRILVDPSVGSVGYGIEYAYTVMERLRLAALYQNDEMTQMPMICNLGKEAWRAKEARVSEAEEPSWGDERKRAVLWESVTAMTLAMSGADILVMRHPRSVELVKRAIEGLTVA